MNKKSVIVLLLCAMLLPSCSNLSILPFSTATPAFTLTPSVTPTKTAIPTRTATLTITPRPMVTIEAYSKIFPLEWPLEPLSDEQIKQVNDCDVETLASERYPEKVTTDELIYLFEPKTSCDWAILTFAYAIRANENEKLPDIAQNAFAQAMSENPGFAFSTPLFYRFFFDAFPIVKQPPLSEQEIASIRIEYTWEGIGDPVEYKVDIRHADTNPSIAVTNYKPATVNQNLKTTVEKELIQALGKSLSNLLPVKSQFSLIPCYDNYPDWTITLTYKDDTVLAIKTNASNMLYIGGPWQTNIEGQDYVQFSIEFIVALDTLIQEIGLPYGQPAAMTCAPESVLDKAYP